VDVDAALRNQAYTHEELLELAEAHDPGFQRSHFAEALNAVRRLPLAEFTAYGLRPDEARRLVDGMVSGPHPCVEIASHAWRRLHCGSAGCQAIGP
jgi:hypothetical protein